MTTQPIIEVHGLSAGYDGRTVLHDIDLTVYENDFLGIIGPNGGGKTTLIKCILGLLKPTAGKITYNISTMGYLPQYNTIDRKFPISVEEVILSGLSSKKSLISRFTDEQREKVRSTIAVWDWKVGKPCDRTTQWRTITTCFIGACHCQWPVGRYPRRTEYLHRQTFRSRLYELLAEINKECAIILVSHDIGTVLQQVKSIACVNETLDYHPDTEVTTEWLERNFNCLSNY